MINRKPDNLTMIQIFADLAKLYISFIEQKGAETDQHRYYIKRKRAHHAVSLFRWAIFSTGRPGTVHPMARALHMDALSQKFLLLILKNGV
jgi:hypothetical protein